MFFDKNRILAVMETMRRPNGAFIASQSPGYQALWLRDTLYCALSYWYLNEYEKLKQGVWVVFDLLKKYREKIKLRIASPIDITGGVIHAKYDADTLSEITTDTYWGHHQLDALGLFLHIVADLDFKNIRVIRDDQDVHTLELIVMYLRSVEYWYQPDFGMWEECKIRHSSSVGAVVDGLTRIRNRRIVNIPDSLIRCGEEALKNILPCESKDFCRYPHHNHDCDSAQLSLLWPYNVIANPMKADEVLSRITTGHRTENGETRPLTQKHGLNRYWGDDYYRSTESRYRGISAEWPMFKFWISIVYSQKHDHEKALEWFCKGTETIMDDQIPEAYQNGKPNDHTPLAWAHAIALIAWTKLPEEVQKKVSDRH